MRVYRADIRGPGQRVIRHNLGAKDVVVTVFRRRWFRPPLCYETVMVIPDRDTVRLVLGRGRYIVTVVA